MLLYVNNFYKVIVIKLDFFGSSIVNERNFSTFESAELYANTVNTDDTVIVVTEM